MTKLEKTVNAMKEESTFRRYEEGEHTYSDFSKQIFKEDTSHKCPTYIHKTPPCQGSCPSGEDIRGWLQIVRGIEKAPEGMSVLVVNYELEDMTLEAHAELGSEVVSNFSPGKIDGLIGKTFIGNVENGVFGGVYYFKNQDDLNNYLNSDLWKGIVTHPNLVNFKTDIYEVASISLVSNGVPIL